MDTPPFGLGAIESPKDERDWTLASAGAPTSYPESAFLDRATELRITMQGAIGSCVGNTFEEIMRYIGVLAVNNQEDLSWRFVYAMCKALEGTPGYEQFPRTQGANDGTYPALAAQVVRKWGIPLAIHCPNDITLSADDFCYGRVLANIPQAAKDDAYTRRSGADFAVSLTADGIRQAITYAKANKGAVAILRRIGDSYWKDAAGNSTYDRAKLLPIRTPNPVVSGHEEFLYGYDIDPANGRTRIYWQNHWGGMWCSTGGMANDGGRAWEYLDEWLSFINEARVVVPAVPVVAGFRYDFTKQLFFGMKGPDVVALQHVLQLEGCFDYPTFTGTFGAITQAGVKKLQEKYAAEILTPVGLVHGTGVVGPSTLAWLRKHYGITS